MDAETRTLFGVIFEEAHVVDFDFSRWDHFLRLVVAAGLARETLEERVPLYVVDFHHVHELAWSAQHLRVELPPGRHCQWVVIESAIAESEGSLHVSLSGVGPCPELSVLCERIAVHRLETHLVDQAFPDWNRPYSSLVRPSLEELITRLAFPQAEGGPGSELAT